MGPQSTPRCRDDGRTARWDRCCSPAGAGVGGEMGRGEQAPGGGCSAPSPPLPRAGGGVGGWDEKKGVIFKRLLSAQTVITILRTFPGWVGKAGRVLAARHVLAPIRSRCPGPPFPAEGGGLGELSHRRLWCLRKFKRDLKWI